MADFKAGDGSDLSSYRQNSSMFNNSDVLEEPIFDSLYQFINDKLNKRQHGLRKNPQLVVFPDKVN